MKWMKYSRDSRTVEFKLEEHEMLKDLPYTLEFTDINRMGAIIGSIGCGNSQVNSDWIAKFKIPDAVNFVAGQWSYSLVVYCPKGLTIIATGYSYGVRLTCNQAMAINE